MVPPYLSVQMVLFTFIFFNLCLFTNLCNYRLVLFSFTDSFQNTLYRLYDHLYNTLLSIGIRFLLASSIHSCILSDASSCTAYAPFIIWIATVNVCLLHWWFILATYISAHTFCYGYFKLRISIFFLMESILWYLVDFSQMPALLLFYSVFIMRKIRIVFSIILHADANGNNIEKTCSMYPRD